MKDSKERFEFIEEKAGTARSLLKELLTYVKETYGDPLPFELVHDASSPIAHILNEAELGIRDIEREEVKRAGA